MGGDLNYTGSSTIGKFITDASRIYRTSTFTLNTAPESGGGEKAAANGSCDLGGVARDVSPDYLAQGVATTLIGKDAIAVKKEHYFAPAMSHAVIQCACATGI